MMQWTAKRFWFRPLLQR